MHVPRKLSLAFACALALGCGGSKPVVTEAAPVVAQLQKVKDAFDKAMATNNKVPRSVKDIEKHFAPGDDPQALLKSPRDGQPFVILWGVSFNVDPDKPETDAVFIHEKDGSGGRYVVFAGGMIRELSDAQFSAAAKAPAAGK